MRRLTGLAAALAVLSAAACSSSPAKAGGAGAGPVASSAAAVKEPVVFIADPAASGTASGTPSPGASGGTGAAASASASDAAATASGAAGSGAVLGPVSYLSPVKLGVRNGSFLSVQVTAAEGATELDGSVSPDGAAWSSQAAPKPASAYKVSASIKDSSGATRSQTLTFSVAAVPDDKRLRFDVTPDDGTTVGIGQPVVVRFLTPVTKRADIEKALEVTATAPAGGGAVEGGWHWLNAQEIHWRPKEFWTPGTKVTLNMKIAGVQASANRYGRKDYSETFTIGASHVTKVDASSHRVRVYRDGKLVNDWPGGTGKAGLETYSGTYIVLGKAQVVKMDSCSAKITCDKKDPDYYDEEEYWATRITNSGTFLHAAGWDGLLGKANVSHGCVHLSDAAAKEFYGHAVIGDVVTVVNSGRGPEERIKTQDPGLYDWNLSWSQWTAGSALK